MARSNYQFKKRQKELARKKKKEEKRQRKLNKNIEISEDTQSQLPEDTQSPSQDIENNIDNEQSVLWNMDLHK